MAHSSKRGMTLLELIIVIVIFSMLLAFSVYFLKNANRDLGVAASANHVVSLLRAARDQARATASPAWVVLNTKENSIYALTRETVGEWHLEDMNSTGAFGRDAKVTGGTPVPGRVGKGIQLGSSATIHCGEVPVYAPDQGVSIELWFLRKQGRGRAILATVGDQVELAVEGNGRIEGRVGSLQVSSGQVRLPLEAWCYVQLIYSGRDLRLILNQNTVSVQSGNANWTANSPLIVGDSRSGLTGIVDEIRLGVILAREKASLASESVFEFPPGVALPANGEFVVAFDPEGKLDAQANPGPVRFAIKSPAARAEIVVHPGGSVQREMK